MRTRFPIQKNAVKIADVVAEEKAEKIPVSLVHSNGLFLWEKTAKLKNVPVSSSIYIRRCWLLLDKTPRYFASKDGDLLTAIETPEENVEKLRPVDLQRRRRSKWHVMCQCGSLRLGFLLTEIAPTSSISPFG